MNGFEAIANILKKEGFEWMACFPANPLIEAAANVGIRPIVFRQERKKDSLFCKGSRQFKIMAKIQYLGKPKT